MPHRFSNMQSDWDMANMTFLLFISGLSSYDQLLYKEGSTLSIHLFQGEVLREGVMERDVTVYLNLKVVAMGKN